MRILVVERDAIFGADLTAQLEEAGHAVAAVGSAGEALARLGWEEFDVMFSALRPGSHRGVNLLAESRSRWPRMLVVLLAGSGTVEEAVSALHEGAFDYLRFLVRTEQVRRVLDLVGQQLALRTSGTGVQDPVEYARVLAAEGGY